MVLVTAAAASISLLHTSPHHLLSHPHGCTAAAPSSPCCPGDGGPIPACACCCCCCCCFTAIHVMVPGTRLAATTTNDAPPANLIMVVAELLATVPAMGRGHYCQHVAALLLQHCRHSSAAPAVAAAAAAVQCHHPWLASVCQAGSELLLALCRMVSRSSCCCSCCWWWYCGRLSCAISCHCRLGSVCSTEHSSRSE